MWRLRDRLGLISKIIENELYSPKRKLSKTNALFQINKSCLSAFQPLTINRCYGCGVGNSSPIKNLGQITIMGTSLNEEKSMIRLHLGNSTILDFPVLWLRDNCQCPDCYDEVSHSRILDQQLLKQSSHPTSVTSTAHNVSVTWDDGHRSVYTKEWLINHSFEEDQQGERSKEKHLGRVPWNATDFKERFRKFSFNDLINNDAILLEWLTHLAVYGVSIFTGAQSKSGELEKLAERIAFIRKTHYGEIFSVIGSDDANNVAYKKGALQLHTDLPYYNYTPGIIMLHCVQPSTKGGESMLSDGLNAASLLPKEMFRVLAETVVDWVDIGQHENKPFYSINREPVLCFSEKKLGMEAEERDVIWIKFWLWRSQTYERVQVMTGILEKVNWSQPQRDSVFNVSAKRAVEWYNAAIEFTRIIHDKNNCVTFKMKKGEILAFDNRRTLHGRSDYTDSSRLLYGAYIDWDDIYSRIRVLKKLHMLR